MQTQYFIKRIEGLIAGNELGLAISLLRKFTKCSSKQHYQQVLKLSSIQQQFQQVASVSEITLSERMRYQHATTRSLLELLASLENSLPINLPLELADLALHLLHAVSNREAADASISFKDIPHENVKEKPSAMLVAIPAAKPVRLSIASMLVYTLLLLLLGAIAPSAYLIRQHLDTKAFAPYSTTMTQSEIADLAAFYDLTEIEAPNHHLNFDQNIISYWYGRIVEGMEADKVETAFAAFNEVIMQAQDQQREILTHEDLYMISRPLIDKGLLSQK